MKKSVILMAAVMSVTAGCNRPNVERASKEFNELPPVVQQVVRMRAAQAEVVDVTKRDRNGLTTYVIEFYDSKRYPDMEIGADGRLVKYQAGTEAMGAPGAMGGMEQGGSRVMSVDPKLSALPTGVQKAIIANTPKADVMEIRRRTENGQTVYEIEYAGKDPRRVIYVTPGGDLVEPKQKTESRAPKSVTDKPPPTLFNQ